MIHKYWPLLFLFIFWVCFSFPYIFQHKVPYPATHEVNAFYPWSRYSQFASPIKNDALPDVINQIYPWKHFTIEQLKKGSIPFWNPYSFSGTPHMANYQSAVFSPMNTLYFILPFIDAWSLTVLLQPLFAAVFTYLYMRKVKVSSIGSLIASIAFMFSGFMVVWMAYGTLGMAIAVLPLLLYFIEVFFDKKSFFALLGISFAIAFSFLSGHFQTSIYISGMVSLYLLYKTMFMKQYVLGVWSGAYLVLGLFLAMPQILPSLEFFQNAPRSVSTVASGGIPFYNLITIIAPDFFGNPVTRNNMFLDFAEWQAFIGTVPFVLSLFAISFSKKKSLQIFFFIVGFVSLILAIASPLQNIVAALHIPVISSSTQSRIIAIFSFCFALLAGFGFDNLRTYIKEKKHKTILSMLFILVLIIGVIWIILFVGKYLTPENTQIAKKNFILPSVFLSVSCIAIAIVTLVKKKYIFTCFQILILCMVTFESFRYVTKWMPFDPKELVFPSLPITDVLQKEIGTGRIYGNMGQQMTVYYKLGMVEGYDPLYIQRYGQFLTSASTGMFLDSGGRTVGLDRVSKNTDKILNLLAVHLILHPVADTAAIWAYPVWQKPQMKPIYNDQAYVIYKNNDALPRAKMFYDYEVIPQKEKSIQAFYQDNFPYQSAIILEEKPPVRPTKNTKNNVTFNTFEPNTEILHVFTQYDGMLFVSDPYYPGWKAYIDGKETKIYRADYAFRAITIPPGNHTVIFQYFPKTFLIGCIAAIISLIGMFSFAFVRAALKER